MKDFSFVEYAMTIKVIHRIKTGDHKIVRFEINTIQCMKCGLIQVN